MQLQSLGHGSDSYSVNVPCFITKKGPILVCHWVALEPDTQEIGGGSKGVSPGTPRGENRGKIQSSVGCCQEGKCSKILQGKVSQSCARHFNLSAFCPQELGRVGGASGSA